MTGETDLSQLLATLTPELNPGAYVFCSVQDPSVFPVSEVLGLFQEQEGTMVIVPQHLADQQHLPYSFVAAWITLRVHSSLEAVGLTAAFATALTAAHISCNVVAGFYHDHIFVAQPDAEKALRVLQQLSASAAQ
ncbi:ACT domain-containing protein [Hymenobacter seoulensis]